MTLGLPNGASKTVQTFQSLTAEAVGTPAISTIGAAALGVSLLGAGVAATLRSDAAPPNPRI